MDLQITFTQAPPIKEKLISSLKSKRHNKKNYLNDNKRNLCVLPPNAKEIIEILKTDHKWSVSLIAKNIGVATRTLYRILNGQKASGKIEIALVRLYFAQCLKKEKN